MATKSNKPRIQDINQMINEAIANKKYFGEAKTEAEMQPIAVMHFKDAIIESDYASTTLIEEIKIFDGKGPREDITKFIKDSLNEDKDIKKAVARQDIQEAGSQLLEDMPKFTSSVEDLQFVIDKAKKIDKYAKQEVQETQPVWLDSVANKINEIIPDRIKSLEEAVSSQAKEWSKPVNRDEVLNNLYELKGAHESLRSRLDPDNINITPSKQFEEICKTVAKIIVEEEQKPKKDEEMVAALKGFQEGNKIPNLVPLYEEISKYKELEKNINKDLGIAEVPSMDMEVRAATREGIRKATPASAKEVSSVLTKVKGDAMQGGLNEAQQNTPNTASNSVLPTGARGGGKEQNTR